MFIFIYIKWIFSVLNHLLLVSFCSNNICLFFKMKLSLLFLLTIIVLDLPKPTTIFWNSEILLFIYKLAFYFIFRDIEKLSNTCFHFNIFEYLLSFKVAYNNKLLFIFFTMLEIISLFMLYLHEVADSFILSSKH